MKNKNILQFIPHLKEGDFLQYLLKDDFSRFFFETIAYGYAEINLDELIRKVNQNQIIENIWNKK